MRKLSAAALLLASFALVAAAPAQAQGIEGRWLTFDNDGKTKRSVVEIRRMGVGFKGSIVEFYPKAGEKPDPVCVECPGEARGKRIRGLEILTLQSVRSASEFEGRVLDPQEGKEYRATAVLDPGGKTLTLRGYVVLPVFGRNEVWTRAP